jgi:hypothetical protein
MMKSVSRKLGVPADYYFPSFFAPLRENKSARQDAKENLED